MTEMINKHVSVLFQPLRLQLKDSIKSFLHDLSLRVQLFTRRGEKGLEAVLVNDKRVALDNGVVFDGTTLVVTTNNSKRCILGSRVQYIRSREDYK